MVSIRPYNPSDNAALLSIEKLCPQGDDKYAMGVDKQEDVTARYAMYDNSRFMVAEEQGKVVGWIGWTFKQVFHGNYVYLTEVNVHPEFQHKRIATNLIEKLEKNARKNQAEHIYCYIFEPNTASKSLFSSRGYESALDVRACAITPYKEQKMDEKFKIVPLNKKDIPEAVAIINDYYDGWEHFQPYTNDSFLKYISEIPGYGLENFWVIKENGKMVACAGLWDSSEVAQMCFVHEPFSWKLMNGLFHFLGLFTKTPYITGECEFFKLFMISNHAFRPENEKAMHYLIAHFYNQLVDDDKSYLLATMDPEDPVLKIIESFGPQIDKWSLFYKSFMDKELGQHQIYVDVRDLIP